MFKAIREEVRIRAEFEESLTVLCCVVHGLNEEDLSHIQTAVRCISSRTGKQAVEFVADCIDELLHGKELSDTQIGLEISIIFGGV